MPKSKEHLALDWAQLSEQEKKDKRKKHAETQRKYRAKIKAEGLVQKRSEMSKKQLAHVRELDRKNQKNRKINMTEEEKDCFKAKDRERKAKARKAKKDREMEEKAKNNALKKVNQRQKKHSNAIQKKIRDERSEEEKEKRNAEQAECMRTKRSNLSDKNKMLEKIAAKKGMRVCRSRKFGYLRKYKQRKIRDQYDPFRYHHNDVCVGKDGFSTHPLWEERKERMKQRGIRRLDRDSKEVAEQKSKERLKKMNRDRVKKYRLKMKKLLEEPVILEEKGEKGAYELLREKNIKQFEKLKQESGLFN